MNEFLAEGLLSPFKDAELLAELCRRKCLLHLQCSSEIADYSQKEIPMQYRLEELFRMVEGALIGKEMEHPGSFSIVDTSRQEGCASYKTLALDLFIVVKP